MDWQPFFVGGSAYPWRGHAFVPLAVGLGMCPVRLGMCMSNLGRGLNRGATRWKISDPVDGRATFRLANSHSGIPRGSNGMNAWR